MTSPGTYELTRSSVANGDEPYPASVRLGDDERLTVAVRGVLDVIESGFLPSVGAAWVGWMLSVQARDLRGPGLDLVLFHRSIEGYLLVNPLSDHWMSHSVTRVRDHLGTPALKFHLAYLPAQVLTPQRFREEYARFDGH